VLQTVMFMVWISAVLAKYGYVCSSIEWHTTCSCHHVGRWIVCGFLCCRKQPVQTFTSHFLKTEMLSVLNLGPHDKEYVYPCCHSWIILCIHVRYSENLGSDSWNWWQNSVRIKWNDMAFLFKSWNQRVATCLMVQAGDWRIHTNCLQGHWRWQISSTCQHVQPCFAGLTSEPSWLRSVFILPPWFAQAFCLLPWSWIHG
jgi:hypothetical protein